ncbi:MAG TPA: histidinol-phosphate transaminase [Flavobacteriales bacterium]|nr:histidinol-phosphate transaminase [Flavobacteriales bacterium]
MADVQSLIRKNVRNLKPYSSARDEFKGTASVWLDANENPNNNGLNRYPDPLQKKLKERISKLKSVPTKNIFLGNGSDEAIDLLFRGFCEPGKDKALICSPTYGMYQVSADINDVEVIDVPLTSDWQLNTKSIQKHFAEPNLKLIFICSPNNPTGNSMNKEDVLALVSAFNGLVIIDEAYIDFSEVTSLSTELEKYNNLVILQTLSKAWGLAGIRLGMAFANTEIIDVLNRIKPPYNINQLTQEVALKELAYEEKFQVEADAIILERKRLKNELQPLKNVLGIYPSDANFLLVRFANPKEIYAVLSSKGIVVRDRSNVVEGCLRITVGTEKENALLIKGLKKLEP